MLAAAMASLGRERLDPGIEVLRLDRPERRNALNSSTLAELVAVLGDLARDEDLRVLVLSSTSERAFCAGADVSEALDAEGGAARMRLFASLYAALEAFGAPTICACAGDVVGAGAEIAAGADLRVGSQNLRLAWAGARLGVPVGPARLAGLVGLSRARDLLLTGRVVGMEEAFALGFLNRTVPAASTAESVAVDLARQVAGNDVQGVRRLKRMLADFEGLAPRARVAAENEILVSWQDAGPGLPHRPR